MAPHNGCFLYAFEELSNAKACADKNPGYSVFDANGKVFLTEHSHTIGTAEIDNKVEATCFVDGSYDEVVYCTECEEELSREPFTIPALGYTDADNDGHCDTCGDQMTGGDHCAYCGKIHGGAFGWLVRFFHKIFALF